MVRGELRIPARKHRRGDCGSTWGGGSRGCEGGESRFLPCRVRTRGVLTDVRCEKKGIKETLRCLG